MVLGCAGVNRLNDANRAEDNLLKQKLLPPPEDSDHAINRAGLRESQQKTLDKPTFVVYNPAM
jgi:hypothetical protein